MTQKSTSAIVELARQCSESARRYFEDMGRDLDRRMGAALARRRERGLSQSSQLGQSANHVDDQRKLLAASTSEG